MPKLQEGGKAIVNGLGKVSLLGWTKYEEEYWVIRTDEGHIGVRRESELSPVPDSRLEAARALVELEQQYETAITTFKDRFGEQYPVSTAHRLVREADNA